MASISLALSKGRIFDETAPLLARVGIRPKEDPDHSRRLVIGTQRRDMRLIVVRASDTPTYVQHGGADLGIAGMDVLAEHGGEGLYQPVDLGIARCRMVVAVRKGFDYAAAVRQGARLRVATKYVRTTREHFAAKGVHVDLIRLYGSMELAPQVGLADAIVDLVATGRTLRANSLVAVEEIMPVSARLIVNQAALKTKRAALQPLIEAFGKAARQWLGETRLLGCLRTDDRLGFPLHQPAHAAADSSAPRFAGFPVVVVLVAGAGRTRRSWGGRITRSEQWGFAARDWCGLGVSGCEHIGENCV